MTDKTPRRRIIALLALTQVISWGSLYYAFSVLAPGIQRELGWRGEIVFGAFSWSLLVAGLASTPAGMLLDRIGGRPVMGTGSLLAGLGLLALATAHSVAVYFLAWTVLGIAMAATLYEAAFATINREFEDGARQGISTLTLFGGLASTVFWPLTIKLDAMLGWRHTLMVYAAMHLALCLPAHLLLTVRRHARRPPAAAAPGLTLHEALRHPAFWMLALAFATNAFVFSALSVHLIPVLGRLGHAPGTVALLAALIGPLQVAGRIGELAFAHRTRPQAVGKLVFSMLPAALLCLVFLGMRLWAVALFCVLYGLSNGILTIVRGTIPHALFGRDNYGAISGAMAGPTLLAKAAGPLAMALLLQSLPTLAAALAALLAFSMVSLLCFLAAVRDTGTAHRHGKPA